MGLVDPLRGRVIRALADLDVFADHGALRELVQTAVGDQPRAKNFINGIEFRGAGQVMARRLVVKAGPLGDPPGDFLARILGELLASEAIDGQSLLVLNAALERLQRPHTAAPGEPPPAVESPDAPQTPQTQSQAVQVDPPGPGESVHGAPTGDGPLVMVSFSHRDFDAVKTLVAELRARGVRATWDQDAPPGSDIPIWVWSTYQRADWVVLACSGHYHDSVEGLLRHPVAAPPTGKGVAQEVRFMASEHIHHGPERFVPVLLPGSQPHHIPLVAQVKLRFSVPDQYEDLARCLRKPRSRRASAATDEDGDKEPEAAKVGSSRKAIGQPPVDADEPPDMVNVPARETPKDNEVDGTSGKKFEPWTRHTERLNRIWTSIREGIARYRFALLLAIAGTGVFIASLTCTEPPSVPCHDGQLVLLEEGLPAKLFDTAIIRFIKRDSANTITFSLQEHEHDGVPQTVVLKESETKSLVRLDKNRRATGMNVYTLRHEQTRSFLCVVLAGPAE